jgi:glycosyltransferase involved in cell wall biosynthesis
VTGAAPIYFNGKFYSAGLNGVHRVADRLIRECDRLLGLMPREIRPRAVLMTSAAAGWVPDLQVIERRDHVRTGQLWEQLTLPRAARDGVLVNLANFAPVFHRRKITMIHDAQFLFPDCGYPARQRRGMRLLSPLVGRSSTAVLTVSEYSRRMLDLFRVADASQITVVANGADHMREVEADDCLRQHLGLQQCGYVVLFGSGKGYKNNAVVFDAFTGLAAGSAPLRLVVIGPARAELETAGLHPPADTVFAGRPGDGALKGLLQQALCLAFPSRTEGFGLPPLEAMLSDCPVVASPGGAIPEACGDAVIYAGTDCPAEWAQAFRSLRDDPALRARKIAAGRVRAAGFTWEKAGRQLMDLIAVAGGRSR